MPSASVFLPSSPSRVFMSAVKDYFDSGCYSLLCCTLISPILYHFKYTATPSDLHSALPRGRWRARATWPAKVIVYVV